MEKTDIKKMYDLLYKVFAELKSADDFALLLDDLCTYNERDQMAQRLYCAKLLLEKKTYNEIIETTNISSATLSRVSRCIQHGSDGYKKALSPFTDTPDNK